ncbi:MAG: ParA family protein [Myxococcota bacterium]
MTTLKQCSVCGTQFLVKFRFQIEQKPGHAPVYYCSQKCRHETMGANGQETERECSTCGTRFVPKYAYQRALVNGEQRYFCRMECRTQQEQDVRRRAMQREQGPMRIAVLNQKGGTGKTTTAVTLASGLSEEGFRVLVIDVDSQGHVAVSLGERGERTMYHLLVEDAPLSECVVRARPNMDILCGNETLASTEIFLARLNEGRDRVLRRKLESEHSYDFIIMDCGPSLSLLNMNALTFADHLIVPVSCDFLSLVGVKQLLKTLKNVNQVLMHPVSILGILPTFYDMRNNISDESVKTLRGYFHDKVLPPIRVNTRLKEAPRHRKTIFEYAPESRGAADYRKLVRWVVDHQERRSDANQNAS